MAFRRRRMKGRKSRRMARGRRVVRKRRVSPRRIGFRL